MKVTIIHGQNHKGSTYNISKILAEKLNGEITEFFLPRDFDHNCTGCTSCFMKDEKLCPHYCDLKPITDAMDSADVLIFESPVYVYHVTGAMKSFLDHYGYRWMIHRPEGSMFTKQAVCISTAAGAGMKSTNKDIADSLFYWGVPKIYKIGVAVATTSWKTVSEKKLKLIERKTSSVARKISRGYKKVKPGFKTKFMFNLFKMVQKKGGWNPADVEYWKQKQWTSGVKPWK